MLCSTLTCIAFGLWFSALAVVLASPGMGWGITVVYSTPADSRCAARERACIQMLWPQP